MNTIKLKSNQVLPLFKWRDKNLDLLQQFHPFLWNFEIDIEGFEKTLVKITYDQELDLYFINITEFMIVDGITNNIFELKLTQVPNSNTWKTSDLKTQPEKLSQKCLEILNTMFELKIEGSTFQEMIDDAVGLMFATNAYFFHYKKNTQLLPVKIVEKHTEYKHGKYKTINVVKLENQYTIIGRVRCNKILKQHQWHIDCWDVRGHERHYKNGKIIFIKPYQKGKNKNNKETSKIYKIN